MLVLGLQGSPRQKGNTNDLLQIFMNAVRKLGVVTQIITVARKDIKPCQGCGFCEKNGFCIIKDDMVEILHRFWQADLIVMATPVFFYSTPSQLKALIDRTQVFWARKYRLNLRDPKSKQRRGFLLALGATKGDNVFEGIELTAKYFFDAVGADFIGSLTYRRIENLGDLVKHPAVLEDVKNTVNKLLG